MEIKSICWQCEKYGHCYYFRDNNCTGCGAFEELK